MGDNLRRMGDAGHLPEDTPLRSHHPRYFETPQNIEGRPNIGRGRGHIPSPTHYRQPPGPHLVPMRPRPNHPGPNSMGPEHLIPMRSRPHPSTDSQTRPHPPRHPPTQSPSNPQGARYNQPRPQYSSTPNNQIERAEPRRPMQSGRNTGPQTTPLATPTTGNTTRESNKDVRIGDKLYKSYNKQGKVRVVVPGNLSLAPPSKSSTHEKPYDRIKGRSSSDPRTPPLSSDPPRRSSSSDQSTSSPNLTNKKTVTFSLPRPTDHTHHMDTPTKPMTNLSDFEKSSSSDKPRASLSTEKKEHPTPSGRDKGKGVASPTVDVVKSKTGHLQASKPAGNSTIGQIQSSSKKNTPHSSTDRLLSDTRQGKAPSPSPHHNKPPQAAPSAPTQPPKPTAVDALINSSLNSLVNTLINDNITTSSAQVPSSSATTDKHTKRKLDKDMENVVKKRKMSGNSSTTTSEDETRASAVTTSPARKKPRKNVAVKKVPYRPTTGAESTGGKVDQHDPTITKKSLSTSSFDSFPIVKTEPVASPIRSKSSEVKDPSGIDAMMARAQAFLMSKSPRKNSNGETDDSIQDPLRTQPIPLPKAPSPHATCRFKHVDGTLCSNEAINGERLCSEHIKFPEKLKAMLGLSPIKATESFTNNSNVQSVTNNSNTRNLLTSMSATPTSIKPAHVVTTPSTEPDNDIHNTTSDPSLTTSSISVISLLSNESLNETPPTLEEQKISNSTKEKDANSLIKKTLVVSDSFATSVPFSPLSSLAPPTDEDMVVDPVPHPLDDAHNQSSVGIDLKTELAGLNRREESLQTALVESGAGLSKVNDEIYTLEGKLQQLTNTRDQLMNKCDKLTREYQEVLSLKQSLLISKYVPKYVSNPVKESKSPPSDPHSHSTGNQSHSHTTQSRSDSSNTTQQHKNLLKRSSELNPDSETPTPKRINTKPSGGSGKTVTMTTPILEAESRSQKQKAAAVSDSPTCEVFFSPLADEVTTTGSSQKIPTFKSYSHSVLCLKVHNDKLFACSSNNEIRSYCLKTGKVLKEYVPHQKSVTCLAFYHTDKASFLLSGSSDKLVHLNNIETGKVATKFKCTTRVMYIVVEESLLYIAQHSGVVAIINLQTRQLMSKHKCHDQDRAISSLAVHQSSMFTASFDNTVICWDIADAIVVKGGKFKKIKVLHEFNNTVLCMKVHNGMLFCGSADKSLQVFKIGTWEKLHCLKCHNGAVTALEVIGKVLVTSCFDKLVRCFDIERLQLLQVYGGHDDMIFSLTSNNGVIYTGCRNGLIRGILLDLTKFYQCKWKHCELQFGVLEHLKDHVKGHCPTGKGAHSCQWEYCQFYGLNLIQHILDVHLCQL